VEQVENVVLSFPTDQIESTVGTVGETSSRRSRGERGPHVAQVKIKLADATIRTVTSDKIFRDLRARLPGAVVGAESIELRKDSRGPPLGEAVHVQVLGEDRDLLRRVSGEIQDYLRGVNGVYDITDSFEAGKDEVHVEVDEALAARFGLSVDGIGRTIRTAIEGTIVATVQEGDEDIDVRVRYLPEHRRSVEDIATLRVPTLDGNLVPFGNVATLSTRDGLGQIDRTGRERVIAVSADVDSDIITSVEVNSLIGERFADVSSRYPGIHIVFGGEASDTIESLTSLAQAFIIALLVMYSILGATFKSFTQPFVVLFAIPFALIGVVVGFFIMGKPLTFMSLFGVIALAGIVVNDSLLLVYFINDARARGIKTVHAVVISAKRRFRPVMLTTLSTVAGILPLTLVSDDQSAWLSPMATAIVWGLSFSTVLVLLLVPALYLIDDDIHRRLKRLFGGSPKKAEDQTGDVAAAQALRTETG